MYFLLSHGIIANKKLFLKIGELCGLDFALLPLFCCVVKTAFTFRLRCVRPQPDGAVRVSLTIELDNCLIHYLRIILTIQ